MTSHTDATTIRGERALTVGESDRLGFSEVAKRIATALVDHASDSGFVIGLDGQWGSGKSSLLALIAAELEQLPEESKPTLIRFQPWLIGHRDALLTNLFNQLVENIASVELARGDATSETKRRARKIAEKARTFAMSVSKAGDLVKAVPIGITAQVSGAVLNGLGKMLGKPEALEINKQKSALIASLRDLKHRFIVTVDDVDRLEPAEVVEVLRLVRSVADFPNIVYLLCYDSGILAESVRRGADVPDGAAFLEKIVQLTVMVPQPEPFQLRQWFGDEVLRITGGLPDVQLRRLRAVIDHEGGKRLQTPRAVVRSLDSLRFFWPALREEKVDVADLVWLLLIKDHAPKLYRWVESYLATAAVVSTGIGTVSETSKAMEIKTLKALVGENHFDDLAYRHSFAEQLPGVEIDYAKDGSGLKLFESVSDNDQSAAITGRRLASPDHYRLYLALIGPGHAITQQQLAGLWSAASETPIRTAKAIIPLGQQPISPELTKADLFLERLPNVEPETITETQATSLLIAFSDVMDMFDRPGSDHAFMLSTTWDRAEKAAQMLIDQIGIETREALLKTIFEDGRALGWLTHLLRRETFAHGRYGDQRRPEQDWILSEEEYDRIAEIMVVRYRALSISDLLAKSRPLNMLFAWAQAGDPDGPKGLLTRGVESDEGLISVLCAFITVTSSSDRGSYEVIARDNVKYFLDFDALVERVRQLNPDTWSGQDAANLRRVQAALKNRRSF